MSTEVAASFITTEDPVIGASVAVIGGGGGGGGGGDVTLIGLAAARPAAPSTAGLRYYATDTKQEWIGVNVPPLTWFEVSPAGSGGGTTVGTLAARPAVPSATGAGYYASDTKQEFIGVSGAWVTINEVARRAVVVNTASIPVGSTTEGTFDIGTKAANFLQITGSKGGYLVLYSSDTARASDAGRSLPATEDALRGLGVLAEFSFPVGGSTVIVSPPIILFSTKAPAPTSLIYYRWYNGGAATQSVTLTLYLIGMEF